MTQHLPKMTKSKENKRNEEGGAKKCTATYWRAALVVCVLCMCVRCSIAIGSQLGLGCSELVQHLRVLLLQMTEKVKEKDTGGTNTGVVWCVRNTKRKTTERQRK